MFNFKKISKVILVAGALAFASFYSHSSHAAGGNGQGTEEYNASTYGEGTSRSMPAMPALGGPAGITTSGVKTPSSLSAPAGVKNKLEMAEKGSKPIAPVLNTSSTVPTNVKLNQSLITGRISESDADGNTKAKYDSAKKRLDTAESDYQKELKRLNGLISEDGISKSDKKKYQDQISTLKSNYKKEKNAAIKELSAANSAYQKEQLDNASSLTFKASSQNYLSARQKYNDLAKEFYECGIKGSCPVDLKSRMEEAKKMADEAYVDYKTQQEAYNKKKTSQSQEIKKAKTEAEELRSELQNAQKGCEYYEMNGAVSKAAKADKKKLCDDAKVLEEKLRAAEEKLFEAQQLAQDVGGIGDEHRGEIYAAVTTNKGNKDTIFDGTYRGYASYDKTDGNVLQTVTRRAARIIVALKPIVYVFAGFGLIGFAFMAIFNKLSWKWFANIAMGLFLVANMGRFIEYFVFKDEGLGENDALQFGSFVEDHKGLSRTKIHEAFADTKYQWVEESAFYLPPKGVGGELQASIPSLEEEDSKARGFCGKTEGASGWGNFASCIKDITSAGKKAVDAAKTAKNTLDTVKNGVESVKFAAQNIGDAAKNIGKSGSVEGVFNAFSQIGNNVNNMVGTAGGVVNGVMSNASRISNDIQDVSKSTDQVAELNKKRAKGEGTNAIDRALKGQKTGADGSVEHLYGGTDQHGNAISGKVASDSNIFTNVKNTTDTVVQKSKEANSMFQGVNSTVSAAASVVSNTSLSDLTMGLAKNDTTLNNKLQDKRQNEQARANEKRVQERETKRQQEAERKRQEKAEAEAAKEKEQSAAAKKKAEDDYINSFLNKANAPDGSAQGKAETAVEEAKKQAAEAQKAEAELSNKQKALEKAEKDAQSKESEAARLEKAAEAARLKADRSGSEADKKAADLAAGRAQTARAQADQATLQAKNAKEAHEIAAETYEKAKEPLSDMADKARAAAIEAAKEAKADAEKKAKAAADSLTKAQESATKQQDKVKEKQSEYEKAVQKAKETNSREDILAVQAAEQELNKAKNQLSNFQDQVNTNKKQKQAAEEKAAAAEVFAKKVEAEKDYGLTKEVEKQLQQNDKEVKEIRETYTKESTPDKVAEKASAAAEKARIAAAAAESKAKQEKANAEKMAKLAKEAEEKAARSGKASDKRAAEQAKRRAELAASTAQNAEKKAQEAAKPVAGLEETARQSEINSAKYEQESSKQAVKEAETAIKTAQAKAKTAAEEARKAADEANAKARQAAQSNDDNDILAARQAAVEARQKQKEAQDAQKKIDEEIRRRNEAEMAYYAASTRQAELEEAKKTGSSSKTNNSGTSSGSTVFAGSSTNSSVTGSGGGSQNTLVTAKKSEVVNKKPETSGTAPLTRAASTNTESETATRSASLVTSGTPKTTAATTASGSGEAYKPTSGGSQLVNAEASKQITSDKATMQIVSGGKGTEESAVANSASSSSSGGVYGSRRIRIPTSSAVAMSSGGSGASSGAYKSGARSLYKYGSASGYASSSNKNNTGSVSNSATGAKSQNVQKEMSARAAAFRAKQDELMRKEAEKEALMSKQAEMELRAEQTAAAEQALQERLRQTDEEKIKELTAAAAEAGTAADSSSTAPGTEVVQPVNPKVLPRSGQVATGNIPLASAF